MTLVNHDLAEIGLQIRINRAIKGYNQVECAKLAGISPSYLSGVERGKRNIAALNLIKIAKILDVKVGEFFQDI